MVGGEGHAAAIRAVPILVCRPPLVRRRNGQEMGQESDQ
jgi:hypothetical protein